MDMQLETDGLLSVTGPIDGSLSYQADELARRHPTPCATVTDFYELSHRYYEKLIQRYYPEIATRRTIENERRAGQQL